MVLSKPIHIEDELPPLDEHLVEPGTRYEMYDGELVYVPPCLPPHGIRQAKVVTLVEAYVGPEFQVADDMLTRTSRTSDFAPDVSVFPLAPDPRTGRMQLTELAFEVVSTESLGHAGRKAAKLIARGVRRVFAIDIDGDRMLEWSGSPASWRELDAASHIEDPVFAAPLPIELLIHALKTDDGMSRAMIAKKNPVVMEAIAHGREEGKQEGLAEGRQEGLAEGRQEGLAEGRQQGLAEALFAVLSARSISLDPADRARILGERDPQRLRSWFARAARCTSIAEMFAEP
jgi:Uma2 family endonuclease